MCFGRNLRGFMRLVCATEEWLGKYLEVAKQRDIGFQIWPSRMSLLVAEGRNLIAGVMVYDSTGPFLFFEHLVTNESASLRARHRAVSLMADEMVSMCRHFGKVPQVSVRHRGIRAILERVGLQAPGATVMTCAFHHLETHDYEKPFNASPTARRLSRSAPTEPSPPGDPEEHFGVYASVLGGGERVEA